MSTVYYRDIDDKIKGKFVNCDTKSVVFAKMERIVSAKEIDVHEQSFEAHQKKVTEEVVDGAD